MAVVDRQGGMDRKLVEPVDQCSGVQNEEEELERSVWSGQIRMEFSLASTDIASTHVPRSYLLLSSRMSYLPVAGAQAIDYFRSFAVDLTQDVWFEGPNGVALRRYNRSW